MSRITMRQVTATRWHASDPSMQPDYSRQQILKEVGAAGQARLAAARVLVIGAGGLGSPVLQYLAGAGVGCLGIVDGDTLEASNLHRQPLYCLADVGKPKSVLASAAITDINPTVKVEAFNERLTAGNALGLVSRFDLVVECSDNFQTKFLVNDAAVLAQKCAIFASVYQFEGQLQVYRPDMGHACLRCLWPKAAIDGVVGNCAQAGVLGPVPGVLGTLQALMALKVLLGLEGQLAGELLLVDFSNLSTLRIKAPRCAECRAPACARIHGILPESANLEICFASLTEARDAGFTIIDIRTPSEVAEQASGARHIPMQALLADPEPLKAGGPFLLLCASGKRSLSAARDLAGRGIAVKSFTGGLSALPPER
jgi:molybdopterin/thiamine biosynthesis adenylyltransferase/rhodanese-related sulfurtransferase